MLCSEQVTLLTTKTNTLLTSRRNLYVQLALTIVQVTLFSYNSCLKCCFTVFLLLGLKSPARKIEIRKTVLCTLTRKFEDWKTITKQNLPSYSRCSLRNSSTPQPFKYRFLPKWKSFENLQQKMVHISNTTKLCWYSFMPCTCSNISIFY